MVRGVSRLAEPVAGLGHLLDVLVDVLGGGWGVDAFAAEGLAHGAEEFLLGGTEGFALGPDADVPINAGAEGGDADGGVAVCEAV